MNATGRKLALLLAAAAALGAVYWWARLPGSRAGQGEPPSAGNRVKLVWVGHGYASGGNANRIIAQWSKEHPDIDIEYKEYPGGDADYMKSLDVAMAVNEPMDVMMMDGGDHIQRATEGVLLDFGPYLQADRFDPAASFGSYMTEMEVKGSYYFLPSSLHYSVLYYNKDMFDEAGLAYPNERTTLAGLAAMASKLARPGDGADRVFGFVPSSWEDTIFIPLLNGGWSFLSGGSPQFRDSRVGQALAWYKGMQDSGAAPSFAQIELQKWDARFLFADRRAAMIEADWSTPQVWNKRRFDDKLLGGENGLKFRYGATFYPRLNESVPPKSFRLSAGSGYVASASTKHPYEAYQFVRFLTTEAAAGLSGAASAYGQANASDFRELFDTYQDRDNRVHTGIYPPSFLDELKRIRDETAVVTGPAGNEDTALAQHMEQAMLAMFLQRMNVYFGGGADADDFLRLLQEQAEAERINTITPEGS
ncbi:ABC transporter substrate-binding protein [Paenibacillus cymbidii]|uniref:ABC transporter substrate-binding protein n=1 Tax=Paenibacillus cymbidii TaxID=1639034 RepID=UPI0010815750|nr:extracellular solute-binding protein [Paenibacillus cymbidii]